MSEEGSRQRRTVEVEPIARTLKPGVLGFYQPRRFEDGRWRFALRVSRLNDHRKSWYPVGYCQQAQCEGHAGAEQARKHFRDYLLHEQLRLNIPRGDGLAWVRCEVCSRESSATTDFLEFLAARVFPEWFSEKIAQKFGCITRRYAVLAGGAVTWALCYEHQSRTVVDSLLPADITELIG